MKVMVTGGAGDLGRDMAPLLANYYDVVTLDIRKPDNNLEFIHCDITRLESVKKATKDVDVIVHLAVLIKADSSTKYIDVNTKGTCNILEAALENGVKKVVYASSVWAASRGQSVPYLPIDENIPCKPEGLYDITKRMGEEFCEYFYRLHGLNSIILRLCGYYPVEGFSDEGDILWDKIDMRALVGRFVAGSSYKLTNAWDLAQAFRAAIDDKIIQHDTLIVGLGAPFAPEEAEALAETPLTVLEKYYPGVSEFLEDIGLDIPGIKCWYNTGKAETHLGFSPKLSLQDIMKQYYEHRSSTGG